MAATAVYVAIVHIPGNAALARETIKFTNIAATTAAFILTGGMYGITCMGSTFGTVTLQIQAQDGTTWLTAMTAISANGVVTGNLPSGSYRLLIA
jgi:hypothetical protein